MEKLAFLTTASQFVDGVCLLVSKFPNKSVKMFALLMNTGLQFFVPLLLILCMYLHILVTLKQRSLQVVPLAYQHGIHQNPAQDNILKAVKNVTKTLMIVTVFFVICWSCNSVYFIMVVEGSLGLEIYTPFHYFTCYMVFLNMIINPILYTLQYKEFQTQAAKIVLRCGDALSMNSSSTANAVAEPN